MAARNYRENCGICHANVCEHTRAAQAIQEAAERFNQPAQEPVADPRDAEIARLRTELDDIKASLEGVSAVGYREGVLAERAHSLKATADGDAEIAALKAEIARLKAEVERLTARITDHEDDRTAVLSERCATDEHHCACVPVLRADLARHQRALAAGPAAVRRQENVDVNTREAYARVVEVAQAAAMKEEP